MSAEGQRVCFCQDQSCLQVHYACLPQNLSLTCLRNHASSATCEAEGQHCMLRPQGQP